MTPHLRDRAPPGASKPANLNNQPPKPVRCIPCQLNFASNETYEVHLLDSSNHFACFYCYIDHHTSEALKRHMTQLHYAEQELQCPGCHKSFNRLGGLMSHMDYKECQYLKRGFVKDLRDKDPYNSGQFEAIHAVTSWGGRIDAGLPIGSPALNESPSVNNGHASAEKAPAFQEDLLLPTFVREEAAKEEYFISFDDAPAPPTPAVPAWDTVSRAPASKALFPNAAPAIAPPTTLMQSLAMTSSGLPQPVYGEHDPTDPNFKPNRYFIETTRMYKCPHQGCKKNLTSFPAFIQHLRSPVHIHLEQVKCPQCLRPFPNATALTQHIESPTVRCDARNLAQVGVIVEDITQVATVDGVHEDETIKYINLAGRFVDPVTAVANVVKNSRRAMDAQVNLKENHWKVNDYQNW